MSGSMRLESSALTWLGLGLGFGVRVGVRVGDKVGVRVGVGDRG